MIAVLKRYLREREQAAIRKELENLFATRRWADRREQELLARSNALALENVNSRVQNRSARGW